jgi:hypothetical protein
MTDRRYPEGKLGPDDDGRLEMAITHTENPPRILVRFGEPTDWIGLTAKDAVALAQLLIRHARAISTDPIEIKL